MQYRRLSEQLVNSLEADSIELRWPPYRAFKKFSIRNGFAFAEREYLRLRRMYIGVADLVESLITYLGDVHESQLCSSVSELERIPRERWVDHLSELVDGKELRRKDYFRGVTWRELPLMMMLGSSRDEDRSFCRNEATARCTAEAQYIEIAKSMSSSSQWRKLGVIGAVRKKEKQRQDLRRRARGLRSWIYHRSLFVEPLEDCSLLAYREFEPPESLRWYQPGQLRMWQLRLRLRARNRNGQQLNESPQRPALALLSPVRRQLTWVMTSFQI